MSSTQERLCGAVGDIEDICSIDVSIHAEAGHES